MVGGNIIKTLIHADVLRISGILNWCDNKTWALVELESYRWKHDTGIMNKYGYQFQADYEALLKLGIVSVDNRTHW